MANRDSLKSGMVYLVGAGPGDPGMITLRAVECLGRADVVLYDYLVNPQLLTHATRAEQLTCLGRHGAGRLWSQNEINEQLVELAQQGKTIVRLKGGDPAVFARGAEEAEYLSDQGIGYEIVPGITAALAAGSCVGIPITHRNLASAVALVTGQEQPEKSEGSIDFHALARFPGTLVFYMGVTTAKSWTTELLEAGKPPHTPSAIVRRCSFADQTSYHCRLDEVADTLASPARIRPPVIVIIGDVTTLAEKLSWFDKRPLFGQQILITRPADQSRDTEQQFAELGAQVLRQPAIEISDPDDWKPVDQAFARLNQYDWIVFSSANGVRYFCNRLESGQRDLRSLGNVKLAAIGPGTADALRHYRLKTDLLPESYRAESLAAALTPVAAGKRFLIARASRGREILADELTRAKGIVEQITVYSSSDVTRPDEQIATRMSRGEIDWVTITSSAIASSTVQLFGEQLRQTRLASISPLTTDVLKQLGFPPDVEASDYTMQGIVSAIRTATHRRLNSNQVTFDE